MIHSEIHGDSYVGYPPLGRNTPALRRPSRLPERLQLRVRIRHPEIRERPRRMNEKARPASLRRLRMPYRDHLEPNCLALVIDKEPDPRSPGHLMLPTLE